MQVDAGFEGVLLTASDDYSTTNSASGRPMSPPRLCARLWAPRSHWIWGARARGEGEWMGSKAGVGKVAVARCRRTDLRQSRARKGSNRLSTHLPTGTPVCLRRKVDARIHWEGQGECRTPKSCAAARAVHRASQHGETAPARNQLLVCSSPFGQGDRVDSVEKGPPGWIYYRHKIGPWKATIFSTTTL